MSAPERVAPTAAMVIDRLDAAQALIETGWCQGVAWTGGDGPRRYCALGALTRVCATAKIWGDDGDQVIAGADIFTVAYQALRTNIPDGYASVAQFNDATTKLAVIGLFLRAKNTAALTGVTV